VEDTVVAKKKLLEYLDNHNIRYVIIKHSPTYTAQEIAASLHIPGKEMAKTVMVRIDGNLAMTVLPASYMLDLDLLKEAARTFDVEIAREADFAGNFPDCNVGAMPPFGNLYGMEVYVAESLTSDDEIAFNACSHTETMRISFKDYIDLVRPKIARISQREYA
jgi:Ala-tRNA(Pro) deacylase